MAISARDVMKSLGLCDKIVKKFSTTTTDYDLFQDTDIKNALLEFYNTAQLGDGVKVGVVLLLDSITQVKVNNQGFYNDLIGDLVFSIQNTIKSLKIKDTGKTGTIEINIL